MPRTDFERTRRLFDLPDGVVYLDGNSLGPLPKKAKARVARMLTEEWGKQLIRGWVGAGWMALPERLGDRIGTLIGAPAGTVMVGDTLSIKVFQALAAALAMRPDRRVVLSDTGNFPSDLYMAAGLLGTLGQGHRLVTVAPEEVEQAIDDTIAVLMLTEVDYRTGRLHDMKALTERAHRAGALTIWDLAHSAGAIPVDLAGAHADFAVGCTYKYLNGGPGAPAFIYIRPDLQAETRPVLAGWLGHAAPFAFEPDYRPGAGMTRMRVGTPPVIQMTALDAAMDVWKGVDMGEVRARSIELSELFIREVERRTQQLRLASPRDPAKRGSQVSFRSKNGYAVMQALIARGVIGDFRAPDLMRFGFTPLYTNHADVIAAAETLEAVLREKAWDQPQFRQRAAVT